MCTHFESFVTSLQVKIAVRNLARRRARSRARLAVGARGPAVRRASTLRPVQSHRRSHRARLRRHRGRVCGTTASSASRRVFFFKKTSPHSEAAVRRVRTSTHGARRDRARTARAMRLDGRRRLRGRGRRCARVDVDARRRPRRVVAGVVDDADERELARVERWRDHARGVARARAR